MLSSTFRRSRREASDDVNASGSAKNHVFVARVLPDVAMRELDALDAAVHVHRAHHPPSRQELLSRAAGASALITLLSEQVDDELLGVAGPELRVVANCAVGYDNIDLAAAERRGVVVTNTPGVLDDATADLTLALMLAASRRVVEADRFVRAGNAWTWDPEMFVGLDISAGATLGIVGVGRIGIAVGRRARAFGLRLLGTRISQRVREEANELGVEEVELATLLADSDVVTLHCPLSSSTRHLIGAPELHVMPSHALLVNTSRGAVIDERALVTALEEGTIGGAALDVFEHEPDVDPRLLELDNVITLPHIGSAGRATRDAMALLAVRNVSAVLSGQAPLTAVRAP